MKVLDLSNDSITEGLERCAHGNAWDACKKADCQEIWRMYQETLEEIRKLDNQEPKRTYWSKQKSEYEVELEKKSRDLKPEDYEIKLPDMPSDDRMRTRHVNRNARCRSIFGRYFLMS